MTRTYNCPICEANWGELNPIGSFEICSCGMQFGYQDAAGGSEEARERIYDEWRKLWIANDKQALSKEQQQVAINLGMGRK